MATTCTSIVSGSLIGVHFWPDATSRRRMPWFITSSVTSTSMFSGMSVGKHSTSTSRVTKSSTPPCCLTPRASPLT